MSNRPGDFFIILNHQKEHVRIPVVDEHGSLVMFATHEDAINHANEIPLGRAYGYEVFELGMGR